jgi:F-box/WD-40 domain protein 5
MLAHYQLSPTCTLPCRTDNESPLTWYSELKRLIWHAPVHLAATLRVHTDEVLHVSFSPDGRYFCTSSKDCSVKVCVHVRRARMNYVHQVFSTRAPYTIEYEENDLQHKFHWRYTQYTEFNASGQLLLVSGTTKGTTNGEIIVFALIGAVSMHAVRVHACIRRRRH